MNLIKIATAGSVDDGKSTLIGRLLYDTNSIPQDKLEELKRNSLEKGEELELALLTDGLVAEREQGITIDVAHIYFNTAKRKYIIADSPGHVEYTRNMITGTSTADVSVILIDASKGISEQTKQHLFITKLLQVEKVFIVVNKLDLLNYDKKLFDKICDEVKSVANKLNIDVNKLAFIPASSKYGVNIVKSSEETPWFKEGALLEQLEVFETKKEQLSARFNVQLVIRPNHNFRGYAGKVLSGVLKTGDTIVALPNKETARITAIYRKGVKITTTTANQSVVIELDREIDISRGSTLVSESAIPREHKDLHAEMAWMTREPLNKNKKYTLQHGSNSVSAKFKEVGKFLDTTFLNTLSNSNQEVKLNSIFNAQLNLSQSIFLDEYTKNKANGRFIIIDQGSNNTVAVGFVR